MNPTVKNAREGVRKLLPELSEEACQYLLGYGEGYVMAKDSKPIKETKRNSQKKKKEKKS